MALDRDLAVAFFAALDRPLGRGWEVTAATGVRGLRLLREAPGVRSFLFTEASPRSFDVLRQNVADEPRATASNADGRAVPPGGPFDYVDVDPYGSPLPFLAGAIAATTAGGLLGVTATDMTVLAGAQPSACRRRYGAEPVRGRLGPEGGLRILLMVLARQARAAGRSVRPLLGYVGGHHVRAYVEVGEEVTDSDPVGRIDPAEWRGPPLPGSGPFGPFWLGPIIDRTVASRLRPPGTAEHPAEVGRLVELLREDAEVPAPFYYEANALASSLGLASPPSLGDLLSTLRDGGYRAGRTHVRPEGLRTDAPRDVVERTARAIRGDPQSQNARVRA
jgi:tRNA (guanine26-N2/guanine27-N2)-dimethyltransferase